MSSRVGGLSGLLARVEGEPAAAAMLLIREGVAMLAGASTLPAFRNRGLQSALARARLASAASTGCDVATMGAQPGTSSQRNAERLGFRIAYTKTAMVLARSDRDPREIRRSAAKDPVSGAPRDAIISQWTPSRPDFRAGSRLASFRPGLLGGAREGSWVRFSPRAARARRGELGSFFPALVPSRGFGDAPRRDRVESWARETRT